MFVYIITHLRKKRYYIGITNNTSRRIAQHKASDSYLGRSIKKYGEHEFDMKIVAELKTIPEAQKMEVELIKLYTGMGLELYNQSLGGEYRGHSNRNMLPVPDAVLNNAVRPIELAMYIDFFNQGDLEGDYIVYNTKREKEISLAKGSHHFYSRLSNMEREGLIQKHDVDNIIIKMSNYDKININFLNIYLEEISNSNLRYSLMALLMKNKWYKEETVMTKLGVIEGKVGYTRRKIREVCNIMNLELEVVKEFGREEYKYRVIEKGA